MIRRSVREGAVRRFGVLLAIVLTACSGAPETGKEAGKQAAKAAENPAASPSPAASATPSPTPAPAPNFVLQPGKVEGPMSMAFLPDGRMLIGQRAGGIVLRAEDGAVTPLAGVPDAEMMRDIAVAADGTIYFAYSEPQSAGGYLALARATVGAAELDHVQILWHGKADKMDGSLAGAVAIAPDQRSLYLSGARQRWGAPALPRGQRPKGYHRPIVAYGSIVRLDLPAPDAAGLLPLAGVRAKIVSTGHRNPLGLAIAGDGRVWEHEMGPKGGDEVNLIEKGKDYGWPTVSNGDNYDGTVIPDHKPGDGFEPPMLFWNPSISPAGFILYSGRMFPEWRGSGFMGMLSAQGVARVTISGAGAAKADEWPLGMRIRDVAEAPDGAIWIIEDDTGEQGRVFRLGR
jgi:glucose/arabinose dehydrogenase